MQHTKKIVAISAMALAFNLIAGAVFAKRPCFPCVPDRSPDDKPSLELVNTPIKTHGYTPA